MTVFKDVTQVIFNMHGENPFGRGRFGAKLDIWGKGRKLVNPVNCHKINHQVYDPEQ